MSYKNEKITAIVACRMGSSRFPGKTLHPILGKPMIYRIIERIQKSKYVDNIIIATTVSKEDDAIQQWCDDNNIQCFRGSASDVLDRLYNAAEKFKIEHLIQILGDNPLIHSDIIDNSIECYFDNSSDYTATITNEYSLVTGDYFKFPIGVRVEIISKSAIERCHKSANTPEYREHATSYILKNPGIFKTTYLEAKGSHHKCNKPELTFAVKLHNNMLLIERIFDDCYEEDNNFTVGDAIDSYERNFDLSRLMGNDAF